MFVRPLKKPLLEQAEYGLAVEGISAIDLKKVRTLPPQTHPWPPDCGFKDKALKFIGHMLVTS